MLDFYTDSLSVLTMYICLQPHSLSIMEMHRMNCFYNCSPLCVPVLCNDSKADLLLALGKLKRGDPDGDNSSRGSGHELAADLTAGYNSFIRHLCFK